MKLQVLVISILLLSSSVAAAGLFDTKEKVGVIQLSGPIKPDSEGFSPSGVTPERVRELTNQARSKNVEAIIYEINSGGGAVVASKEVMRSIEAVETPTVCRIRDIGTSGAYLASLGCDKIVADSASLTGSIGVKASYLEFSGLLNKLGIEYVNLTTGEYKDVGSRYQNISESEKELLQQKISKVHQEFVDTVKRKRNLSTEGVEEVGTGEAFLGETARQKGLVDELGGRKVAMEAAENMTGEDLRVVKVDDRPSFNFLSLLAPKVSALDLFSIEAPLKSTF